jgi:hypothetical protein
MCQAVGQPPGPLGMNETKLCISTPFMIISSPSPHFSSLITTNVLFLQLRYFMDVL